MNDKIDIVIPWVDDKDLLWKKEKEEYRKKVLPNEKVNSHIRFQSWDNLKFWFRTVENFMPWINRIFFITWGHIPSFLNENHSKVRIIKHEDYIPKQYLPTFNSNTIEMNYYRISELSENFIVFNDDCFPLQPIKEEYYFKNNMVCDEAIESPIMPLIKDDGYKYFCTVQFNNLRIINKHFKKREVQKEFWKWFHPRYGSLLKRNIGLHYWYNFVGFRDPHMPNAMKKSTLKNLWEIEPEILDIASKNHFRDDKSDVSQYLARYWQLCLGEFYPRRTEGKYSDVTIDNYKSVADAIRQQKYKFIVINENCTCKEFEVIKEEINSAFEEILPNRSSFEK